LRTGIWAVFTIRALSVATMLIRSPGCGICARKRGVTLVVSTKIPSGTLDTYQLRRPCCLFLWSLCTSLCSRTIFRTRVWAVRYCWLRHHRRFCTSSDRRWIWREKFQMNKWMPRVKWIAETQRRHRKCGREIVHVLPKKVYAQTTRSNSLRNSPPMSTLPYTLRGVHPPKVIAVPSSSRTPPWHSKTLCTPPNHLSGVGIFVRHDAPGRTTCLHDSTRYDAAAAVVAAPARRLNGTRLRNGGGGGGNGALGRGRHCGEGCR
jgi:hypothetical protein